MKTYPRDKPQVLSDRPEAIESSRSGLKWVETIGWVLHTPNHRNNVVFVHF